jgi:tRNA A-37 threonylcarbamoyl transferase component Bud32
MSQGRYRIVQRLATGGMAEVYRARAVGPEGFEKDVCLKRILPQFARDAELVEMFKNEARLAAKLQHANIVQIFDFGEEDGAYYLAMELVEGRDLRGWLEAARRAREHFPIALAAFVVHEAARGLAYAHGRREAGQPMGVVHRDVSPHNLLVSRAGEVKVADFGIAKVASRAAATRSGVLKGKVGYMSPEQARGAKIDARTDVFALGVVLWELCARRRLFRGETETETLGLVLNAEIEPLHHLDPAIPEKLSRIAERALDRDLARRYASMDEMVRDLKMFLHSLPAEEVMAETLAAFLARIDPPASEGTSQTRRVSEPGTEPTMSAPLDLASAGARDPTRAAGVAAHPNALPAERARADVWAPIDTVAGAPTSMTRSEVRERATHARSTRRVIAAGAAVILLVGGAGALWWVVDAGDDSLPEARSAPRMSTSHPAKAAARAPAAQTGTPAPPRAPVTGGETPSGPRASVQARAPREHDTDEEAPPARRRGGTKRTQAIPRDDALDETSGAKSASTPDETAPATPSAVAPTPKAEAAVPAPPKPAPLPEAPGFIAVTVIPWAEIYVDGQRTAAMPRAGIPATPGVHQVRLRNRERGYDRTFDVRVVSGERVELVKEIDD